MYRHAHVSIYIYVYIYIHIYICTYGGGSKPVIINSSRMNIHSQAILGFRYGTYINLTHNPKPYMYKTYLDEK